VAEINSPGWKVMTSQTSTILWFGRDSLFRLIEPLVLQKIQVSCAETV
jgi:hypothetical protein